MKLEELSKFFFFYLTKKIFLNVMDVMSVYLGQSICIDSENMPECMYVSDNLIVNSNLSAK